MESGSGIIEYGSAAVRLLDGCPDKMNEREAPGIIPEPFSA
ncbi:hypothetical protein [Murimonas intestini]|nr:hypothetical protein [Murimonas intestini]MCR1839974.1 hypothetical protein [Murimonas intestini]